VSESVLAIIRAIFSEPVIAGLRAFAVLMFGMNVGVIMTWVDRRQGALIQDRVGPDRAVMWLPTNVARVLAVLPALGAAAAVMGMALLDKGARGEEPVSMARAIVFSQLAVFMTWVTLAAIVAHVRRRGPESGFDRTLLSLGAPRALATAGVCAQVGLLFALSLLGGSALGRVAAGAAYGGGVLIFVLAMLGGAAFTALNMKGKRVGIRVLGLLHPAADGLKTAFKEDIIPLGVDRLMYGLAPWLAFFPSLIVLAVVPFADTLCFGTTAEGKIDVTALLAEVPREGICETGALPLQVADLNVGILYFFAVAGTGIVGAALAGWASDNKYSLLGGLRAASQMVSYEVTLGLTLIGGMMIFGSLQVDDMVRWQRDNTWGIFVQPLAFVLFFAAAVAESKRIPFDIPEGESELVAGYFLEYCGMKFAMFQISEYIAVVSASAVMAAIFLGGWDVPFLYRDGIHIAFGATELFALPMGHLAVILLGLVAFVFKVLLLCWLQLSIRWTLPRFRYDQVMRLGWRVLLPLSLGNILVTGLLVLVAQSASDSLKHGLDVVADITKATVAASVLVAFIVLVRFLLSPPRHQRNVASTSARYASAAGGTQNAEMGA
jgi:NADH-quinone oxidoreductase subunit H